MSVTSSNHEKTVLVASLNLSSNLNGANNNIMKKEDPKDFYIGLSLALLSSFFIGSSFILKKKGLIKLSVSTPTQGSVLRAAQGGYGYLKEWLWWAGLITMGVGELCNFAAYGFAPATLVTPLGALSVLVSAIMSSYFLNEKLNSIGKIGCFLTAVGSTVMVIHAPKEGEVNSVNELLMKLKNPEFIIFTIISIGIIMVLIIQFVPRYGNKNVLIYILICSILGSFTVMSCKGLSLGFKEMFSDSLEYKQSASFLYTYLFAFIVIACIVMQMNYLNKALDIFNTAIVTTIYYVLFTLCVMIASSILFKELTNLKFIDFVGCIAGFATIICALCLIHFFKNDNQIFIDDSIITNNNDKLRNFNNNDDDYDDDEDYGDQKTKPSTGYFDNNKIIKRFLNTFNPNNVLNSVSFSNNKSNIEVSLGGSNNNTNNNYILLTTEQDDGDDVTGATTNNNKFSQKNFHETV